MINLTVGFRYVFKPYFSGYFQDGNFYNSDGRLLKQKYYNGRVCIDSDGKRYGIKKMRTFAKKTEAELVKLPF